MRFFLALRCFFSVLFAGRLPADALRLLPAAEPPTAPAVPIEIAKTQPMAAPAPMTVKEPTKDSTGGAVQLLALFQREGRLLDFLQEEIDGYADAQIGAAVRDIHRGCKRALAEHLPLEPVLKDAENARVRVDAGFDPARIRLVGNVVGEPPFSGTLRHHGWRTTKVSLPVSTATDPMVVTPAEVEL